MNIWLPIITNSILALILIAGIFVGKKNGLLAIVKLLLVGGAAVGCYFLNPIVVNKLAELPFIQTLLTEIGFGFIPVLISLSLALLVLISYLLISLLITIIRKAASTEKTILINQAKVKRARGIDKKTDRALKKEEKKLAKAQKHLKQIGKGKQAVGIIFGFLTACMIVFTLMFPIKYILYSASTSNPDIYSGYEYTSIGQLDKATEVYDNLLIDQFNKLGE